MAHGELLAPAIRDALAEAGATMADLTDVAVGVGPGPFTGLRVGVVTALTLGSTLGLATHGVCTLDILAADRPAGRRGGVPGRHRRAAQGGLLGALPAATAAAPSASTVRTSRTPADLAELHPGLPVVGRGATLYPDVADGPRRAARPVARPRSRGPWSPARSTSCRSSRSTCAARTPRRWCCPSRHDPSRDLRRRRRDHGDRARRPSATTPGATPWSTSSSPPRARRHRSPSRTTRSSAMRPRRWSPTWPT